MEAQFKCLKRGMLEDSREDRTIGLSGGCGAWRRLISRRGECMTAGTGFVGLKATLSTRLWPWAGYWQYRGNCH